MPKPSIWNVIKAAVQGFLADKATQLAAAVAFYTIFSLGPVLIIVVSLAGLIWGERAVRGEIVEQAGDAMSEDTAQMLQTVLANSADTGQGIIGMVVGLVTLALGATVVFLQLKAALNAIWKVQTKSGRPVLAVVRDRLLALILILVLAVLLLASMIVSTVISAMAEQISTALGLPPVVVQVSELLASAFLLTILFALVFKYLPDIQIGWRPLWPGAALTAVLFVAGKFGLGIYLGQTALTGTYGAAGGLIMLLLWVYYSAIMFFLGAEFTRAYALARGADVGPNRHAEPIEDPA